MQPLIYVGLFDQYREAFFLSQFKEAAEKAQHIKKVVCEYLNIDEEVVKSVTRKREVVIARQIGIYFIKNRTKLTLKGIGTLYNRDHTTVIYAIQTVNDILDTDRKFKNIVREIEEKLNLTVDVEPLELCEA